jgi:hypothetical protein
MVRPSARHAVVAELQCPATMPTFAQGFILNVCGYGLRQGQELKALLPNSSGSLVTPAKERSAQAAIGTATPF